MGFHENRRGGRTGGRSKRAGRATPPGPSGCDNEENVVANALTEREAEH